MDRLRRRNQSSPLDVYSLSPLRSALTAPVSRSDAAARPLEKRFLFTFGRAEDLGSFSKGVSGGTPPPVSPLHPQETLSRKAGQFIALALRCVKHKRNFFGTET